MSNGGRYSSVVTEDHPSEIDSEGLATSKEQRSFQPNHAKQKSVILPLLKPSAIFILAVLLAFGHHQFNVFADRRTLESVPVSQEWMNRVGTAFAVSFQTSLSISLSFVICQIMWFTLKGKFLTLSEIDNVYLSTGQDVLATYCSSILYKSPLLVLAVSISFLLSVPTVFTPSSLRVVPHTTLNPQTPCQIPTGDLTNGGPDSILSVTGGAGYWTGITPVAQKLAYSTFIGQKIPLLPQPSVCGLSCSYNVSVPSIAFQCKDVQDAELPNGIHTNFTLGSGPLGEETYWNATANTTTTPLPEAAFWVYWHSTTTNGTNGSVICTVGTATYDFTVQITNGTQSVEYNVTHTGDLPNSHDNLINHSIDQNFILQLSSLSSATRALLLGSLSAQHGASGDTPHYNSPVVSAVFFDSSQISGQDALARGDVSKGIEQLSHNVSAAILTMDLGVKDDKCVVNSQEVIYEYDRLNLWLPYGITLFILLICLVLGISLFLRYNPEDRSQSFSHTVALTRNPSMNIVAQDDDDVPEKQTLLFSLGELRDGSSGFGLREDLKSRQR